MVHVFLGRDLIIESVFSETFRVLESEPFSGLFTLTVWFASLMSVHFSLDTSPDLAPVSFNICRKTAVFLPLAAMIWSNSLSSGI